MRGKRSENIYRILIVILFLGGALGWVVSGRTARNAERDGEAARELGVLIEDYRADITRLTDRNRGLEERNIILEERYRDLADSIPGFIDGLWEVEDGLGSIESGIGEARGRLQSDIKTVSDLAAEIREIIEAGEDIQDGDLESGGGISDTLDVSNTGGIK